MHYKLSCVSFALTGHLTRWEITRRSTCSITEAECSSALQSKSPPTPSAQASPSNPLRLRKLENYHWDWPSVGCMVRFHFFLSYIYLLAPRLKGKISIFSCLVVYVNILYKHASLVVTILSMDCANSFSSWYVCKYLLLLGSLKSVGYGCSPPLGCRSQGTNPTCTMSVCHVFGWTDPNCNRFFPVPVWIEVNVVDRK